MNMICEYYKEREGFEAIEKEEGFIVYQCNEKSCYIRDLWIHPDFRKKGRASMLADDVVKIAKKKGCDVLFGSVSINSKSPTENMQVLIYYGLKISHIDGELIFMEKRI